MKIVHQMYTSNKLNIVALFDFIQFASFDELHSIVQQLLLADNFEDSRVQFLLAYILETFDKD